MIMRWPGKVAPGQVSTDLVMSIDICATVLEAAGVQAPVPLHGKSLFSDEVKEREFIFAARDKMDETHDSMRAIRSRDFKLILNLMPERPWCQYNRYKESAYPMLAEMNVLNLTGQLNAQQAAFFAPSKPPIELFDLRRDPHEVNNVADDPKYTQFKTALLAELKNWRTNVIHDQGVSEAFRAVDVFAETCPTAKVDDWVEANADRYDFNTHGWPAWYPTRSLAEWEMAREQWAPYVFRNPDESVPRPSLVHSKKSSKRK
jgi:uncharacterized sulfatase